MALSTETTERFHNNKQELIEWMNFQMKELSGCQLHENDVDDLLMNEILKTPAGIVSTSLYKFSKIKLNHNEIKKCSNISTVLRALIISQRNDVWKDQLATTDIAEYCANNSISIWKENHVCKNRKGYFKYCQCVNQRLTVIDGLLNSILTSKYIEIPHELAKDRAFLQYIAHSISIENEEVNTPNIANVIAATEYIVEIGCENVSMGNILHAQKLSKPKNCSTKELGQFRKHIATVTGPRGVLVKGSHPKDLPKQIQKFLKRTRVLLRSELHPVIQAALIKFLFVEIHPLVDGNGRISRILLNAVLKKKGYPWITIPSTEIEKYYLVIDEAEEDERFTSYYKFICDCVIASLKSYQKIANSRIAE